MIDHSLTHDPSGPSGHLPIAESAMGRKRDQPEDGTT